MEFGEWLLVWMPFILVMCFVFIVMMVVIVIRHQTFKRERAKKLLRSGYVGSEDSEFDCGEHSDYWQRAGDPERRS